MTANRYCACGLIMSFGLFGCSRGLPPEGETPYASLYPNHEASLNMTDLSTPTESIDLAVLLKLPRAELARRYDEMEKTIQLQEQFRLEGKMPYTLLPDIRLPLVAPIFRDAHYSKDRGLTLPPYLRVDGHDSAVAFHLARYGDVDAALTLVDPGDKDALRLIREQAFEKAYPVEWTRLVAILMHANQISLATGNKEGAKNLISLHMQLRAALDQKAKQGPLGAALLGRGLGTLQQAAAAWKEINYRDLDSQINLLFASAADVPPPSLTVPRPLDVLARIFGTRAGTMALIGTSPGRVADLLNLPLPTNEADTCVAFGDDAKKVVEILFMYRPSLHDYHKPEQFAQAIAERQAGKQDDVSSDCPRRIWDLDQSRLEVTLTPRHAVLGAIVKIQLAGTPRTPVLARDLGPIRLDRSFEQSRRQAAWNKRGNALTLSGASAAQFYNPLKSRPPVQVVVEREPKHDLVSRVEYAYADHLKDNATAAGAMATPLFASSGRPTLAFGEAGAGQIDFIWSDAKTRYRLRFPYAKDKPIALDVSDVSATDLDARAKLAAANDARDRLERLQAQKPFSVVPRQLDTMKLGMSRAEFKKALPRSPQVVERDIPGGVMAAFLGTPPATDAVAREWFARFENDRLIDVRIRYADVAGNKPGTIAKKIEGFKKKLGSVEANNIPADAWSDLPKRGNAVSYVWQDDIAQLTCRQEAYGLELSLRDCPADHPDGAPVLPLTYLGRGVGDLVLGMSKDALLKLGAQASDEGGYAVKSPAKDGFDGVAAWVDGDKVSRIVARHKAVMPLKAEAQASKTLLEDWTRDSRLLGWPNRQDTIGPNLQSLATRDDHTRFRIFWQEDTQGLSVYSEWKELR